MPSTYSDLKLQLMATGENNTTWGNVSNLNLTALEEAVTGTADVTFASGNVTLTLTNSNSSQTARNLRLNLTGTTAGARDLIVPSIEKLYLINNGCADAVTVKNATGTGIAVPAGKTMWVFNNGTNVVDATTHLTSLTLGSPLPVASGGTGSNTAAGARTGLGATTVGGNFFTLTNPSAITFPQINADNTVSALDAATFRAAIGAGSSNAAGTVTLVNGTGTVNGITLTGSVTTTGSLTLGGTLSGVSLTSQVSGTLPIANGGTGGTTASAARSNLGVTATGADLTYCFRANNLSDVANTSTARSNLGAAASGAATSSGLTMATSRLLGRTTAGTGALEEITVGSGLSLSGGTLTASGGAGTVTSVNGSGGTTGLTLTGGPITTSGTLTIGGTLAVANGGTGAGAAASARTNLGVPEGVSQSSNPWLTAVGNGTSGNVSGTSNTFMGFQAGSAVTSGSSNTFFGYRAGRLVATNNSNTAVGDLALDAGDAIACTAMGQGALGACTGSYNVGIGASSASSVTSGNDNTVVGYAAATSLTTGANNIVLGSGADTSSASVSNEITLGNASIATLRCQVTTITSLSDARDKDNIQNLDAGLDFLLHVQPVRFTWNMRDGGKVGEEDTGFVAQQLKAAQEQTGITIPGLVYEENPEKLEAGYGKLVPVLVKAIQELAAKVEALEAQLGV